MSARIAVIHLERFLKRALQFGLPTAVIQIAGSFFFMAYKAVHVQASANHRIVQQLVAQMVYFMKKLSVVLQK